MFPEVMVVRVAFRLNGEVEVFKVTVGAFAATTGAEGFGIGGKAAAFKATVATAMAEDF